MNPDRPGSASSDPGRQALPWKRIGLYVLASRLFIFVLGWLSAQIITAGSTPPAKEALDLFLRWDSNWYLLIAKDGYFKVKDDLFLPAFFPLYPSLTHLVGFICRDLRVAGYLVSNACLYGSCLLLWRLVARDDRREDVADRSVIFLLFGPVTFFFSCIYSDSLFLLLMLGTIYSSTERRWLAAGAWGFFAALTRPVGVLLVLVIAFDFFYPWLRKSAADRPAWPARDALPFLASVFLTLAGLGGYCLYLAAKFGDPLAFLHAQAHWHREFSTPWETFFHVEYSRFYFLWFREAVVFAFVLLGIGFFVKLRPAYSALCLIFMLVYLSTLHLESVPRFFSVLFPFYITLARVAVRFPRLEPFLLAGSTLLLGLSTVLFVNGYWFT